METKALLFGLVGFFIGGLLVAIAANTFEKPAPTHTNQQNEMLMSDMTAQLQNKTGDDYDKAFISYMIEHHQAAVDMAKLSEKNAKHEEIKQLSRNVIEAQENEIANMRQWQQNWGYNQAGSESGHHMNHGN